MENLSIKCDGNSNTVGNTSFGFTNWNIIKKKKKWKTKWYCLKYLGVFYLHHTYALCGIKKPDVYSICSISILVTWENLFRNKNKDMQISIFNETVLNTFRNSEAVVRRCSVKKVFLRSVYICIIRPTIRIVEIFLYCRH